MGNVACCQAENPKLEAQEEKQPIRKSTAALRAELEEGMKALKDAMQDSSEKIDDRQLTSYEKIKEEIDVGIAALRGIQADNELDRLQREAEDCIVELRFQRKAEAEQRIRDRMNNMNSKVKGNTPGNRNSTTPDRYKLGKHLGKGAFGVVRQATDTKTGRQVAVKILQKEAIDMDEGSKERLAREVSIMKSLKHRNIVHLYGLIVNSDKNEMWMIVEFIDGDDLMKKLTSKGALLETTARSYFQQLMYGLHYMHEQNIAHRDLKPDNVLITKTGDVKITDFGLSAVQKTDGRGYISPGLSLKTCCGTPYYVAPEVISSSSSKGYSGFTCDVWSLGILLFGMLLNDMPFVGKDLSTLLKNITKGTYSFPPSKPISPEAKSCIRSILVVDVEKRATLKDLSKHAWVAKGFSEEEFSSSTPVRVEDEDLNATVKSLRNW
eukprot:TRINITY_DN10307_c1_g1_i4.p1 TRINITY_DN10307_c1_g1~~TRINITY_DN10307_c1_g1_i4.p1  ORF type:complete len:474 (+),score=118.63 TRINITY_DN10307_c1_g1_i4:113-1423(+)